jgi:hypothetical protein
MTTETDAIEY